MISSVRTIILAVAILAAGTALGQAPVDWSGWTAGAYGGYLSGSLNSSDPGHAESTGDYDDDSPTAGLFGSYRIQKPCGWVYGVELDLPLYMQKGTAVDTEYFPGVVTYEADFKWGVMAGAQAGRAIRRALVYGYGLIGLASVDGKTLNVDESEQVSPGFVQSAKATHLIWQLGAGADLQLTRVVLLGGRVAYFSASKADHTMPWNRPGPNEFGYDGVYLQLHAGRRF
jgi:opacity protein-like surface antigen